MSAVSPREMEEAINKANETILKEIDIDEVVIAFEKLGIQVKNPDGSFKCWYDIFEDMSEVWKKLNTEREVDI